MTDPCIASFEDSLASLSATLVRGSYALGELMEVEESVSGGQNHALRPVPGGESQC